MYTGFLCLSHDNIEGRFVILTSLPLCSNLGLTVKLSIFGLIILTLIGIIGYNNGKNICVLILYVFLSPWYIMPTNNYLDNIYHALIILYTI